MIGEHSYLAFLARLKFLNWTVIVQSVPGQFVVALFVVKTGLLGLVTTPQLVAGQNTASTTPASIDGATGPCASSSVIGITSDGISTAWVSSVT